LPLEALHLGERDPVAAPAGAERQDGQFTVAHEALHRLRGNGPALRDGGKGQEHVGVRRERAMATVIADSVIGERPRSSRRRRRSTIAV